MSEITSNPAAFPDTENPRAARIRQLLTNAFQPTQLELRDESHLHAGHNAEAAPNGISGGTHFRLTIASPAFAHLSRVDQQRRINVILVSEFASGLHALAIKVL